MAAKPARFALAFPGCLFATILITVAIKSPAAFAESDRRESMASYSAAGGGSVAMGGMEMDMAADFAMEDEMEMQPMRASMGMSRAAPKRMARMAAPPPRPASTMNAAKSGTSAQKGSVGENILNTSKPDQQFRAPEGRMLIKSANLDLDLAIPWVDPEAGFGNNEEEGITESESRLGTAKKPELTLANADARVRSIVDAAGGYVESASTNIASYRGRKRTPLRRANLQLRVPSAAFDSTVKSLTQLVPSKGVRSQHMSSRDVTEDFVDRAARHTALLASHAQLLALMKRADEVKSVLDVQRELRRISQDIESQAARLNSLQKQSRMSSISLSLTEKMDSPPVKPPRAPKSWLARLLLRVKQTFEATLGFWSSLGAALVDCLVVGVCVVLPGGAALVAILPRIAGPMLALCHGAAASLRRGAIFSMKIAASGNSGSAGSGTLRPGDVEMS